MIIADLHIHGKYSQATSSQLTVPNLEKWARVKGVGLLGTGDFTHPKWIEHLKQELIREEEGIYYTKSRFPFLLQTEISLVFTQDGKGRRVHNLVLAPDFNVVKQITEYLLTKGRIDYDGRPIFGISCIDFADELNKISDKIEIIPAHAYTPWFGILGSKSGFNSLKDAFKEKINLIHAIETGLSSDPEMNWRISELDNKSIVSFSDLHSYWPWRIGREATVFELKKLSYNNIIKALREHNGIIETIEVDPAYGKYHWDGHRDCGICFSPSETRKLGGICPKCGRELTIGVEYRIEELADRQQGFKPKNAVGFRRLIPLSDILSTVLGKAVSTKAVWQEYNKLVLGCSEYDVLLSKSFDELKKISGQKIAEIIIKNRNGNIKIQPGYDGVYGVPLIGNENEIKNEIGICSAKIKKTQKSLADF